MITERLKMFGKLLQKLNEGDVRRAYSEILGRQPENENVIKLQISRHKNYNELASALKESGEYKNKGAKPPYPGKRIALDDLDAEVKNVDREMAVSQQAYFKALHQFWVSLDVKETDPFSPAYAAEQMRLYEAVANKKYAVENEASPFSLERNLACPFPYVTQDARTVGDQLIAIGFIIRSMNLPAGARILELGTGWGNTAIAFARMGYKVTTIDIEEKYIKIVTQEAKRFGLEMNIVQGDFFSIENLNEKYDAVVFYESFHHCADHQRLLRAIPRLLTERGKLVLAGETINENLPYPWGLNCSGQAMYCIRKRGWLELCFRESYLLEALSRLGWKTTKHNCPLTAAGITYISERKAA